jgi:hypothetical protein
MPRSTKILKRLVPSRFHSRLFKPTVLNPVKLDLIDRCEFRSFADLGGVWLVEAGYTFHALRRRGVERGILIDTHPTETVLNLAAHFPQLELIQANFGNEEVAGRIDVDAVFLFDVLLHQVRPDWNEILEMYAPRTRKFLVFNQQYTRDETVRLLDLGREEYMKAVPHSSEGEPYTGLFDRLEEVHPDHERKWRDVHHIWQWGITDKDLREKFKQLGFRQTFYSNHGRILDSDCFENHSFIFEQELRRS